ncbi:MAG: hypothetical protein KME46_18485 [Brasilonema angustatum HA4187-MV1]|nr:hypothetical protein [Brasilonema angustatum HA4187-MV1]
MRLSAPKVCRSKLPRTLAVDCALAALTVEAQARFFSLDIWSDQRYAGGSPALTATGVPDRPPGKTYAYGTASP